MILNPNKTKALMLGRSRTVNPPDDDLVLSGVAIWASPNLGILRVKFDRWFTFEGHARGIVSLVATMHSSLLMLLQEHHSSVCC